MKIMRISLAIAAWLVIPAGLSAQVYLPTGFPRFGTFAPSSFDTVNAANLNVNFSIPVLKKAGRGIPFNYIFTYNSSVWSPQSSSGANQWSPTPGFGWNMEGDLLGDSFSRQSVFFGSASYQETQQNCTPPPPYGQETFDVYGPWFYSDPDGTTRRFVVYVDDQPEKAPHCIGDPYPSPASGGAEDGSGWKIVASINTSNNPTAQFTSPSGWQYQPPLGANPYLKDTNSNQVIETTQNGNFVLVDTLGQDALTFTSLSQYSYPNAAGSTSSVTVVSPTVTVRTSFGCSGVAEYGPLPASLVTEIDLPDDNPSGTRDRYLISYETTPGYPGDYTGRIASVTLPTGGTISYSYTGGFNGINCADGSTNTLTRTTPDGAWSYVHTVGTGTHYWTWTTNITDPLSDKTTTDFQGMFETERKVNQGSSTLLETVDTCYNGASIPCTGTYPAYPISNRTVQTTVPGVSPSKTYTTYNSTNNLPTEVDEYDWGPTLARKTLTTYDYNTSCGSIPSGSSITDRPCSVTIENSSGGTVASTSNIYDSNGNLTSVTSGGLTKIFTYDNTNGGRLTTSKDAGNNQTTYGYGGNSCGAFPDTVTPPIPALQTTAVWNCTGAVMTSSTDPNGQTTTFTYDDPMNRLTEIAYPDGGWQGIYYPNPTAVNFAKGLTSSNVRTDQILLDSSGRTIYKKLTSDPAGIDYVTTSYDALGRVLQVSNPYRTSSTGSDTYAYDALNRITSVTHADGGSVSYTYSGNCSTVTDEASKLRKTCSDALGRVTSVTEDPSGLAYQTTYTYDVLNDLTGVTQGSQTRTYSYDSLGRLLSETNPESGTTYYTYDSDSTCGTYTGDLVKRKDNRGISTCYSYDALHRLTSKSYSDSTPTASYSYDLSTVWGRTTTNAKGHLVLAQASSGSTLLAGAAFINFDAMGRVTRFGECTPVNCGSSDWESLYTYDLAGDVATFQHPDGFTLTNQINGAQETTQITSSLSDSTHPATLATITYTPWGAVNTLLNGCVGTNCVQTEETYSYNNRLQLTRVQLGTTSNNNSNACVVYNYYPGVTLPTGCAQGSQGSGDNGNVAGYYFRDQVNTSFGHTASYTYDSLNRLYQASAKNLSGTTLWSQQYDNDRYGNMSCDPSSSGLCTQLTFNSGNNNQLSKIGSTSVSYDAAGNLTSDGTHSYQYDAEGRLISIDNGSTTTSTYNPLGLRAYRTTSAGGVNYWHDASGLDIGGAWGNGQQNAFISLAGRLMADYEMDGTHFAHANALGSTTQTTDWTGTQEQEVTFYPYGRIWNQTSGYSVHQLFASLPGYDPDMDEYQTPARMYPPILGRWMTPDPLGGNLEDPQTLNRYAYVLNNPATLVDPSGLQVGYGGDGVGDCYMDGLITSCSDVRDALKSGFALPGALAGTNAQLTFSSGNNFIFSYPVQIGTVASAVSYPGYPGSFSQSPVYGTGLLSINLFAAPVGPDGPANNGTPQQPSKTQERLERLKNCALGYYGIDPLSVTGLSSDAKWGLIALSAGGIPKSVAAKMGLRVIMQPGASEYTSALSMLSLATGGGGALRTIANFGSKWAGPIAIASAVIDATAIGICTASD